MSTGGTSSPRLCLGCTIGANWPGMPHDCAHRWGLFDVPCECPNQHPPLPGKSAPVRPRRTGRTAADRQQD